MDNGGRRRRCGYGCVYATGALCGTEKWYGSISMCVCSRAGTWDLTHLSCPLLSCPLVSLALFTVVREALALGDSTFDAGNWTAAIQHYNKAIRADVDSIRRSGWLGCVYYHLAMATFRLGRSARQALRYLDKAEKSPGSQPKKSQVFALRGELLASDAINDAASAILSYQIAIDASVPIRNAEWEEQITRLRARANTPEYQQLVKQREKEREEKSKKRSATARAAAAKRKVSDSLHLKSSPVLTRTMYM